MMVLGTNPGTFAPRPPQRPGRGAFTLIEVLATVAFLSIVLPAIMSGISLSLSTAGTARQEAQASALAQDMLNQLVAEGQLEHTTLSGDFAAEQPGFRWTAQISDWDVAPLLLVEVTVYWPSSKGGERSVTLSTLAAAPATSAMTGTTTR